MIMRIREAREQAGLTREDVADEMGVTLTDVYCWEKEIALPRSRQLPLLARVLGFSIDELFTGEDE